LRRDRVLAAKLPLLAAEPTGRDDVSESAIPDERLELVFMCCHPALAVEAQVALTLRAVGGLATEEIARAFLVPAETMKRRLTRAKSKIKTAGIPFAVPLGPRLPERLAAVLAVVYLVFNQGYSAHEDRSGLAAEAIRLGRVLAGLLPAEPEVLGLTVPAGTGARSPKRAPGSTRPAAAPRNNVVPTRCSRRSPLYRPKNSSTGRGSPPSTASWPSGPVPMWSD
jgi:predicted RNA polymerase sigma factor